MKTIELGICALLLAAGAGWAAWLMAGGVPNDIAAAGLGLAVFAALAAYMATDRKEAAMWLRFGLYSGALAVCAASLWTGIVRPLQAARSFGDAVAWLTELDGLGLVLLAVPPPAVMLLAVLWFELVMGSLKYLHGGGRRQRAESDLHGQARLLGNRYLRRLARRQGILLGQWGAGRNAKLIGWSLEGSAITVAPPRAGKGAIIALKPALARLPGIRRIDRHHRPAGRALVHCFAPPPRTGPPRRADRSFRRGARPQGTVPQDPSAGHGQRLLQPVRLHPR